MPSTASFAPLTILTTPFGKPTCSMSLKMNCIVIGTFSDGLTMYVLPAAMRVRQIPKGDHAGEVERRNRGAYTHRLADHHLVNARRDIFNKLTLHHHAACRKRLRHFHKRAPFRLWLLQMSCQHSLVMSFAISSPFSRIKLRSLNKYCTRSLTGTRRQATKASLAAFAAASTSALPPSGVCGNHLSRCGINDIEIFLDIWFHPFAIDIV